MKPDVAIALEDFSKRLAEKIVPQLTGFDANSVAMISAMLKMVSEEWDRAAFWRVEENAAIRKIFRDADPIITDAALSARLRQLGAEADSDLHVSALDAANDRLRGALIDLHAHVEMLDTPQAKAVDDAIWVELRNSVERRKISSANF